MKGKGYGKRHKGAINYSSAVRAKVKEQELQEIEGKHAGNKPRNQETDQRPKPTENRDKIEKITVISKFAVRTRVNTLAQDVAWYPYRSRRFNCFVAVLIAVFWREFVAVSGAALPDFFGEDRF